MYYKNQALEIKKTDQDTFIITVPFQNGFRSFESNSAIVSFLQQLPLMSEREALLESIARHFSVEPGEAINILDNHLLSSELISNSEQSTIDKKKHNGVLLFRKKLLGPTIVNPISWLIAWLCNKPLVLIFGTLAVAFQLWLLINVSLELVFSDSMNARPLAAFLLVVAGLFFHELGHAASAFKFGCRKVSIGFGWYVIYFVMLADLSESWALERRKRLLISLAGGYFQSLFILILGLIWLLSDSQPCLIAAMVLSIYNILNLNPFFRLDGYWIVSDWLNIKNLREKAAAHSKTLLSHPRQIPKTFTSTSLALNIYSIGLILFLPFFYGYVFMVLVPFSFSNLQNEINTLMTHAASFQFGYNLITLFFNCMILIFASILVRKVLVKLWQMKGILLALAPSHRKLKSH